MNILATGANGTIEADLTNYFFTNEDTNYWC